MGFQKMKQAQCFKQQDIHSQILSYILIRINFRTYFIINKSEVRFLYHTGWVGTIPAGISLQESLTLSPMVESTKYADESTINRRQKDSSSVPTAFCFSSVMSVRTGIDLYRNSTVSWVSYFSISRHNLVSIIGVAQYDNQEVVYDRRRSVFHCTFPPFVFNEITDYSNFIGLFKRYCLWASVACLNCAHIL